MTQISGTIYFPSGNQLDIGTNMNNPSKKSVIYVLRSRYDNDKVINDARLYVLNKPGLNPDDPAILKHIINKAILDVLVDNKWKLSENLSIIDIAEIADEMFDEWFPNYKNKSTLVRIREYLLTLAAARDKCETIPVFVAEKLNPMVAWWSGDTIRKLANDEHRLQIILDNALE